MPDGTGRPLVIGLVNNMPDAALRATERQFNRVLNGASESRPVHIRRIALPGVRRSDWGSAIIEAEYEPFSRISGTRLDGLIVTGTEPGHSRLEDEPYWDAFASLVDFAVSHAVPTLWSCLAAHAAVRRLDGVNRRRLDQKLTGVFTCTRTSPHPVTNGLPQQWQVPHSRLYDLSEHELSSAGYRILARSEEAGVDMFTRESDDLFLFLQGHPEYSPDSLLREYRRDLARVASGQAAAPAPRPKHYFRTLTEPDLSCAVAQLDPAALRPAFWQSTAKRFYTGWLTQVETQGMALMQRFAGRERRAQPSAASIAGVREAGAVVGG